MRNQIQTRGQFDAEYGTIKSSRSQTRLLVRKIPRRAELANVIALITATHTTSAYYTKWTLAPHWSYFRTLLDGLHLSSGTRALRLAQAAGGKRKWGRNLFLLVVVTGRNASKIINTAKKWPRNASPESHHLCERAQMHLKWYAPEAAGACLRIGARRERFRKRPVNQRRRGVTFSTVTVTVEES